MRVNCAVNINILGLINVSINHWSYLLHNIRPRSSLHHITSQALRNLSLLLTICHCKCGHSGFIFIMVLYFSPGIFRNFLTINISLYSLPHRLILRYTSSILWYTLVLQCSIYYRCSQKVHLSHFAIELQKNSTFLNHFIEQFLYSVHKAANTRLND